VAAGDGEKQRGGGERKSRCGSASETAKAEEKQRKARCGGPYAPSQPEDHVSGEPPDGRAEECSGFADFELSKKVSVSSAKKS
jgi:hypothetical protein